MITITMRRPTKADRSSSPSFPERTNPTRPTPPRADGRREPAFPAKCDPRPARPPLSDGQRDLAVQYVPLARALARRFEKSWPAGGDDFRATASLALVEAAQAYDPARGVDFSTYARRRIIGALVDAQRGFFSDGWRGSVEFRPRFRSLEADAEARGFVVGRCGEDAVGASLEIHDDVEDCLRRLPARHAVAFRHIYLDGRSQEETAALMGCSKAAMCRMHREAVDRIRAMRSRDADRPRWLAAG